MLYFGSADRLYIQRLNVARFIKNVKRVIKKTIVTWKSLNKLKNKSLIIVELVDYKQVLFSCIIILVYVLKTFGISLETSRAQLKEKLMHAVKS